LHEHPVFWPGEFPIGVPLMHVEKAAPAAQSSPLMVAVTC